MDMQASAEKQWTDLQFERAVNLRSRGIDDGKIVDILGISVEAYDLLVESPEFKQATSDKIYKEFELQQEFDSSWDRVEAIALDTILDILPMMRNTKDGDFLLRAAAVANKANKRNTLADKPLDPNNGSGRINLVLSMHFVQHIEETRGIAGGYAVNTGPIIEGQAEKKVVNMLGSNKLQDLYQKHRQEIQAENPLEQLMEELRVDMDRLTPIDN